MILMNCFYQRKYQVPTNSQVYEHLQSKELKLYGLQGIKKNSNYNTQITRNSNLFYYQVVTNTTHCLV